MTLKEWLIETATPVERLARRADIGLTTARRISRGSRASYRVAVAVSEATDGAVDLLTLLTGPSESDPHHEGKERP